MHKILIYHSIGASDLEEVGASLYTVSEKNFREQMRFVAQVTRSPGHQVTVTFDDGLLDNYTTAFPILKELGIKAYFFVIVRKIDKDGYMSWQQLKEMKDAGMIIGSHGMSHRILTELDDEGLLYEIKTSKDNLEEKLGSEIQYFSVGRGFYNKRVVEKAKEAGYKAVFTSNPADNDGFVLGRIPVKSNWDKEHFERVLNGRMPIGGRIEAAVIGMAKGLLGARLYDKMRTILLSHNSYR
jgi:peptidoglycan/xylan/chitin deacetylase (PgdA/CDA1 family)